MPVVVLSGPEKAGKSTLAEIIRKKYGAMVRHWGPVTGDHQYARPLLSDCLSDTLTVWDRSWVCEHVYATLLGRERRAAGPAGAWLMEWLYGRAVRAVGVSAVVLPRLTEDELAERWVARRDEGDLPVPPLAEVKSYQDYALRFGLRFVVNSFRSVAELEPEADRLVQEAREAYGRRVMPGVEVFCGDPRSPVWVLGERPGHRGDQDWRPHNFRAGTFLPFTSGHTTRLGRSLGDAAFRVGWGNIPQIDRGRLAAEPRLVVACGNLVDSWVGRHAPGARRVRVTHPSYLYRWADGMSKADEVERDLKTAIEETLRDHGEATAQRNR